MKTGIEEILKCKDCNTDFEPYYTIDDCYSCGGNGEVELEMEWEYRSSFHKCLSCGGKGFYKSLHKIRCKGCNEYYLEEDE